MINTKLIIGIIILIVCCFLAFLVIRFWSDPGIDCEGEICPAPDKVDINKK